MDWFEVGALVFDCLMVGLALRTLRWNRRVRRARDVARREMVEAQAWYETAARREARLWATPHPARNPFLPLLDYAEHDLDASAIMTTPPASASPGLSPEERAQRLLIEHLSAKQKTQLLKEGGFTVRSFDGRREYYIKNQYGYPPQLITGSVPDELLEARYGHLQRPGAAAYERREQIRAVYARGRSFCVHFYQQMPAGDQCLAWKVMLESKEGEKYFLATANPM